MPAEWRTPTIGARQPRAHTLEFDVRGGSGRGKVAAMDPETPAEIT